MLFAPTLHSPQYSMCSVYSYSIHAATYALLFYVTQHPAKGGGEFSQCSYICIEKVYVGTCSNALTSTYQCCMHIHVFASGIILTFLPLRFSGGAFSRLPENTIIRDAGLTVTCTLLLIPRTVRRYVAVAK